METLQITPKGEQELKQRTHRLDFRKRSLLILLVRAQSLEELLRKTVLPEKVFNTELDALLAEGFVATGHEPDGATLPSNQASPLTRMSSFFGGNHAPARDDDPIQADTEDALLTPEEVHIDENIILSEAKFLLTDFCVDCFGTNSTTFVEEVRACRGAGEFKICLDRIMAAAARQCPERMSALMTLVREINDTAA
ncbi:MAG: hypothetical protein AB1479_08160 [Pseudomonadota bacterium]